MPSNLRFSNPAGLVILLVFLAFALRLYELGANSLWYDELLQVDIAQGPLSQILPQMERHAALPLDYFLLNGWIKLGRQDFWVRWPALCFGTLTIPLIYHLGRRLFSSRVGTVAAVLILVSSFAIQYSREVRPYALLLVLVLVGYIGLWQVYKTHWLRYWGLLFVGVIGAAFTHYFALFMLLPMGLFVASQLLTHLKSSRYWQHTILFVLCLLLVVVTLTLSGRFKAVYNVSFGLVNIVTQPEILIAPPEEKPNRGSGPPLERSFFIDKVLSPLATVQHTPLLIFTFFFLLGMIPLLYRSHPKKSAILLLLGWLLLPILSIYLFLLYRGTFYATRYILYTLPAYLLLVACGLDRATMGLTRLVATGVRQDWILARVNKNLSPHPNPLPQKRERVDSPLPLGEGVFSKESRMRAIFKGIYIVTLIILFSPLLAAKVMELQTYYTAEAREDWRAVGKLLEKYAGPDDAVIAIRAEPTMNWYYPPADTPFGTYLHTQNIWQAIDKHPRRWFVLSSYSRNRDKTLRQWLQNNGGVAIGIDQRVILFVQQEGLSTADLLAQIKQFDLPQKPLTYAVLARQLKRYGDVETSRAFFQQALELATPEVEQIIRAQMNLAFPTLSTDSS